MRNGWSVILVAGLLGAGGAATAQSVKDVQDTAGNIVSKPLKDLNVVQAEIPPLLQASAVAPYSLTGLSSCQSLAAEIAKLDAVLGPDIDKVKVGKGQTPGEAALGEVERAASSLIPGTGLIRKASGAEAHDRKVKAALQSGWLRRAFLKGTAQAKGCRI